MKNHDKNSHSDALDANLSKLICKDNLPPVPDEGTKFAMLENLLGKQNELSKQSVKASKSILFFPLVLGGMAAAAVAVLSLIFHNSPASSGIEITNSIPVIAIPEVEAITYEATDQTRRIELRDGSTAIAEKGTRFIEEAPRQLKLEVGSLYMLVAKADIPLEVVTPQGKALALGTRFLVSSLEGDTRVAVAQGSVQLVRGNESGELVLARGEEGILAQNELSRRPAPRLSHLVSWARDSLREAEDIGLAEAPRGLVAIDPQGQASRLSLREYSLDVFIENGVARTTIDQTFFNHYHSNTEGTFYFPLPPGAAVSRLAMYVNGVRNEGGMVERSRGQAIYNDIKYANRDPALLEQLEGNLYKLRIFPLEGRQEKRIFLSFTQSVDELYRTLRYWFPMDHTHDVAGSVKIKVRIKHGGELFDAESSTHEFITSIDGGDLVLSYEAADIKPDQDLLLKLIPKFEQKEIAETAVLKRGGQSYLHTRIRPDLKGQIDPKPRQWFILNDTSASRSAADLKAQSHIIKRLLVEADDEDLVAIANLNIDVERLMDEPVSFRDEKAKNAVEQIRSARRIGGTNLAAGISEMQKWIASSGAANPHLLYIGDGLATDGAVSSRDLTALLDRDLPFLGIAVGKKADLSLLRDAANATGGGAYLMNPDEDLNWRVFDLLASMNTPKLTELTWEFPDEIRAYGDRASLAAGEALTLVAMTEQELPPQVMLRGMLNGEAWEKMVSLKPSREDAAFIPRFWAQRHLEELLRDGETHREEVVRLSKKYYVATPFTSLIVLEDDKMYQDYKVEKGRSDHWAAYPAAEKIPVVREPMPWHSRSWNVPAEGAVDDSGIVMDPKTAEEILDTLLPPANGQSFNTTSIDQVRRSLYNGEGFYDLGLYDQAEDQFRNILRVDPYNKAARRWLERCAAIKADYYRAAYDSTRAQMLKEVDAAWEVTSALVIPAPRPGATWSNSADAVIQDGGGGSWGGGVKRNYIKGVPLSSRVFGRGGKGGFIQLEASRKRFRPLGARFESLGLDSNRRDASLGRIYRPFVGDFTAAIPALTTSANDRASVVEMKFGRERFGSVSDEAAALIRAAEIKRRPVRLNEMIITPDGRAKGSHTSPMYLKEEMIADRENWFHIYRELGFATQRPFTPTNLAAIQSGVPHWPPSLKELEARWTVTLVVQDEVSFELELVDPEDASRRMVMRISKGGSLLQVSDWKGEEQDGSRTFTYQDQTVTITNDVGEVWSYEAVEVDVADAFFAPDLEGLVTLDLPLRKPAFYEKQLAGLEKGEVEKKKQLLRHFILAKQLDHRVVTVPKSASLTAKSAWNQLIQLGAGSTPVFDHLTLAAAVSIQSAMTEGSDFLTHFKEVAFLGASGSVLPERVDVFVRSWPDSPYLMDVVTRCENVRAWIPLLDFPDYRALAIERIAAAAGRDAWPDRADLATRITGFLITDAEAGSPLVVSKSLAHFLGREQQENANWRRLVESYQELGKDLLALDSSGVLAVFDVAIKEKDLELEQSCLDLLLETMTKPEEVVILAHLFADHGRHEKAVELYHKALAEIEKPDHILLQKASLSAKQIDEELSIIWQHRALRILSESYRAAHKDILFHHYFDLIGRSLAVGKVKTAMELALEGYELLPDQHLFVTKLATHFQKLGQETERWRWLSTILDRNPKNAEASGAIAKWYESLGMLEKAEVRYAEAHSFDSAHPQWLLKRVNVLYQAGEFEQADSLYRELVNAKWADQLRRLVPQKIEVMLTDPNKAGSYRESDPGEGWAEPGYDDGNWEERAVMFRSGEQDSLNWKEGVFVRQKFEVTRSPRKLVLKLSLEGLAAEVYLNGKLVRKMTENAREITNEEIEDHLRVGENVLAVRYEKVGKRVRGGVFLVQEFAVPRK